MIKAIISVHHFVFFLIILALSVEAVNGTTPKRQRASSSNLIAPQSTPAKVRKIWPVDEHFTTFVKDGQQFAKCNKCGEEYKMQDRMTTAMKNHISNGCAPCKNKSSPVWDSGLFEKVNENGKNWALCRKCNKKLTMNKHSTASMLTHPCYKEWAKNNSVGPPNLSGNISQQSFNGGQQPTINMTPAEGSFWHDVYNKSSAENAFDLFN